MNCPRQGGRQRDASATRDLLVFRGNIPGKPQVLMVYLGGGKHYKQVITNIANSGYKGFTLEKTVNAGLATTFLADMAV